METDLERRAFTAVYALGPGPNPAHANVARSTNGQLRIEFFGDQMPPYMKVMICDESETKFLSGVRCRLYRAAGSGEIWVAEDLGITMRQSEVFEGIDQITLQGFKPHRWGT
jgi:hypothetical protein